MTTKAEELANLYIMNGAFPYDSSPATKEILLKILAAYGRLVQEAAAEQCSAALEHCDNTDQANGCARAENYVRGMPLP